MVSFVLGLALALSAPNFQFNTIGPYQRSVPTVESILGYEIGDRHTVFYDQERVVLGIAKAAPTRVKVLDYGKSTEGRPLRTLAISSPENLKKLGQIQKNLQMIADQGHTPETDRIIQTGPTLVWINQCIHGDETASFESGMELLYNLAASDNPRITKMLQNVVVMLNPVYNPDGHERYVVAYNSLPTGNADRGGYDQTMPSAFYGRANHYRFDMNRDRVALSQAETRQEVAHVLKWNPQVYVDQHGEVETYFFPPVQQSVNANADRARYEKWTSIFGRATASAFDNQGWTYFIRDQYDLYNVCYLDAHATLMGAIGMTHETDGGEVLKQLRSDNTLLTLRDGAMKHFTSALAVLESASDHRQELLSSFTDFKSRAVTGKHAGKFQRVVVESDDPRELMRFSAQLARAGIKSSFAGANWKQSDAHDYYSKTVGAREFKSGTLIVDMAQSQGPFAKALLEPISDFEPEFIQRQMAKLKNDKAGKPDPVLDSYEFYDTTAWTLPYAYGLQAYWCESAPAVSATVPNPPKPDTSESSVGYVLPYSDREDALFVGRLLSAGIKVSQNTRPMKVAGKSYAAGTFFVLCARNSPEAMTKVQSMAKSAVVALAPMTTSYPDDGREGPGSESMRTLKAPKIAMFMGAPGQLTGGALWYLMEQEWKLPFTAMSSLSITDGLEKFTTIVLPEGVSGSTGGKIRDWVQSGGCLVLLGNHRWAMGDSGFFNFDSVSGEASLPGLFAQAQLDPMSFLSYGYKRSWLPMHIEGDSFSKAPKNGAAVQTPTDGDSVLVGWKWDNTNKDLRGISLVDTVRIGRGKVVWFAQDPTFRAQFPGQDKLILNAIILGPGS